MWQREWPVSVPCSMWPTECGSPFQGREEIDVFPLFRPFVLGLCIMFFPTMVLGTINGILSPVCSATSSLVEQQTFDMKKYQEEKDELEREAMLRDPAKAFLVSDEEFDKKIDELGWSLGTWTR